MTLGDCFKDFPPEIYSVVKSQLDRFFSKSWLFDGTEKEDIKQGLILKILENRDQINCAKNPRAYTKKICENYFNDFLRNEKDDRDNLSLTAFDNYKNEEGNSPIDKIKSPEPDPARVLERNEHIQFWRKKTTSDVKCQQLENLSLNELENKFDNEFKDPKDLREKLNYSLDYIRMIFEIKNSKAPMKYYRLYGSAVRFKRKLSSLLKEDRKYCEWYEQFMKNACPKAYKKFCKARNLYEKSEKRGLTQKEFIRAMNWPASHVPHFKAFYYPILINELIWSIRSSIEQWSFRQLYNQEMLFWKGLGMKPSFKNILPILNIRANPAQMVYDIWINAPEFRRGGAQVSQYKLKLALWRYKRKNEVLFTQKKRDGDENWDWKFIFDYIKKPSDVNKLRLYHYRQKSKAYKRLIKKIYEASFVKKLNPNVMLVDDIPENQDESETEAILVIRTEADSRKNPKGLAFVFNLSDKEQNQV